jgi:transcriptional regulator with XRE-family HTH domain
MKSYKELLQTETYWITKIQNDLYNAVEDYLEAHKLTRTQFAEQLGVSKGYVSQVLNGEFNHRLSKLVELSLAIGRAPVVEFEDLTEVAEQEARGMVRQKARYFSYGEMEKEELSDPEEKQRLPSAFREGDELKWGMKSPVFPISERFIRIENAGFYEKKESERNTSIPNPENNRIGNRRAAAASGLSGEFPKGKTGFRFHF